MLIRWQVYSIACLWFLLADMEIIWKTEVFHAWRVKPWRHTHSSNASINSRLRCGAVYLNYDTCSVCISYDVDFLELNNHRFQLERMRAADCCSIGDSPPKLHVLRVFLDILVPLLGICTETIESYPNFPSIFTWFPILHRSKCL